MWIVDDTVPRLLVDHVVLPMGLWAERGSDATRTARVDSLGTSAAMVPSVRGGGPQPLPLANHNSVGGDELAERVRPSRHGSSE